MGCESRFPTLSVCLSVRLSALTSPWLRSVPCRAAPRPQVPEGLCASSPTLTSPIEYQSPASSLHTPPLNRHNVFKRHSMRVREKGSPNPEDTPGTSPEREEGAMLRAVLCAAACAASSFVLCLILPLCCLRPEASCP